MACVNKFEISDEPNKKRLKLDINGLREEIKMKKEVIKKQFKVFQDTLRETEAMLLADLDAVLEMVTKEKEKECQEMRELITTKLFMEGQLKHFDSEMLKQHATTLGEEIQRMQERFDEIPDICIEWRHLDLCQMINDVCHISYQNDTVSSYTKKRSLTSATTPFYIEDYYDCCFDKRDQKIYLLASIILNQERKNPILVYDLSLNFLTTIDISHHYDWSWCIATNEDYFFITAKTTICFEVIIRISKQNDSKQFIKPMTVTPRRSVVLGSHLFTTCVGLDVLYKFRTLDLEKEEDISLSGSRGDGTRIDFSNAVDIQTNHSLLYVLFNSSSLKSVFSFNNDGTLIKEIISNPRGLYDPNSFCLDPESNIIVADRVNLKVFDTYGRPIHVIGSKELRYSKELRSIAYNSINKQIIILAEICGQFLHLY